MKNNMNKMKLIKSVSLLAIIFLMLFTQTTVAQSQYNKADSNGLKQGQWIKMWNNGMVKYKGNFKDDKPVGEFKYFYPSGKLKAVMTFSDNGTRAHNISYHENGKKMAEGIFINRKKEGNWKYFSDVDEKLVSEENYSNGVLNGKSVTYYIDLGKPFEIIEYKNGKKHGKWIKYFTDGKIMTETTYVNGALEGPFVNYDPDGTLIVKGAYKGGEMNGTWLYYDDKGKLYRKEVYNMGNLVKLEKEADKD
jgi:antitoxin component YwqK of YwqJK toxin-antitoxin module